MHRRLTSVRDELFTTNPSMGLRDEDPGGIYSGEVTVKRADEGIVWAKHNAARPGVEAAKRDKSKVIFFRALALKLLGNKTVRNGDGGSIPGYGWLTVAPSVRGHALLRLAPNGSSSPVGGRRLHDTLVAADASEGLWVPVPKNETLSKKALEAFRLYQRSEERRVGKECRARSDSDAGCE